MFSFISMAGLVLAAPVLFAPQIKQDHAADFRARFTRESDPQRKARMMPQYGDLIFQEVQDHIEEGNIAGAFEQLKTYRDQAQSISKDLDAKEADPEKHPAGFKQLQIAVRESLRRVEDIIVRLASDDAKPFLEIRKDLEDLDRHLVHELFPRQPTVETEPPKPKS